MAQSTVNLQKMKSVSAELDKIYSAMTTNKKKMDETVAAVSKAWKGDAAQAYQRSYNAHAQDFTQLAAAIKGCSTTLTTISTTYNKADMAASEAIKSKLKS